MYVLRREPGTRTSTARWSVGQRARDVGRLGDGFTNDIRNRFLRAIAPDMNRIAAINPRAAKRAREAITSVLDGAMVVMENAVRGIHDDQD